MLKFFGGLLKMRCAVSGALLLVVCSAWANRQGRPDSIDVSCAANAGCHTPAGGYDYAVAASLPTTRLTSAESTTLAVTITVTNNDSANPAQGFGWNIEPPGAALAPVAGDASQRLDGAELVQSDRLGADADGGAVLWAAAFPNLDPQIMGFVSKEFLERAEEPDDLVVLTHADSAQPGDVHAMVCRALLLLWTATSVVRKAFVDAGFSPLADDARLWFENVGIDRGFWPSSEPLDQADGLWDLIGHAVDDLSRQMSTTFVDQFSFLERLKAQSVLLSQMERACMWGVSA